MHATAFAFVLLAAVQAGGSGRAATAEEMSVLATVLDAVEPYADTTAARAAGFRPLGFGRIRDLSPFQGQHWIQPFRSRLGYLDMVNPPVLMYSVIGGELRLAGTAYLQRIGHDDPVPSGLGAADAEWHLHQWCFDIPGEGAALANGVDDCRARGGVPTRRQVAMVHVWTDVPSPEGLFAQENLALPFLALGLRPPTPKVLSDPQRATEIRELALALAETYGSRIGYARRVEFMSDDPELASAVAGRRRVIAGLVPVLLDAEKSGDWAVYERAASAAVAEWKELFALYEKMAPTVEARVQLNRQYRRATAVRHHHDN